MPIVPEMSTHLENISNLQLIRVKEFVPSEHFLYSADDHWNEYKLLKVYADKKAVRLQTDVGKTGIVLCEIFLNRLN